MPHPQLPASWDTYTATGVIEVASSALIHPTAIVIPEDRHGTTRPIRIGDKARVGANVVLHGGTVIGSNAEIGHTCVVGEPETGYAMRSVHSGVGAETVIGDGVVLRAGVIVYAGVTITHGTTIGHHTLLRTYVSVGANTQIGHHLTVERGAVIGDSVRCSPGSHITADTLISNRVFLGAGVRTINDKHLVWRDPEHEEPLQPPHLEEACKVGTGSVILAGVTIGSHALVGAGSVVTRDVTAGDISFGAPAKPRRTRKEALR